MKLVQSRLDEFVGKLKCGCSADQVRALRDYLFEDALKLNLATDGDCLVMRRKSNAMSVKDKHAEDIWQPFKTGFHGTHGTPL